MKNSIKSLKILFAFCALTLVLTSCNRNGDGMAGLRSKAKNLWGNDAEGMLASEGFYGPQDEDFIPLQESDLHSQLADSAIPLPRDVPGEPGSGIPSLDQFREAMADLAKIFQNVYFNTDDYVLRKAEHIAILERVASYLKEHPRTYVAVCGNCDERGSESYNLALGTRRANYVRAALVQRGVDPNHIHPVSYGKEKPLDMGHNPNSWAKNRRVEFRIHEKT